MDSSIVNLSKDTTQIIETTKNLLTRGEKILEMKDNTKQTEQLVKVTSELLTIINSSQELLIKFHDLNIEDPIVQIIKQQNYFNSIHLLSNCDRIIQQLSRLETEEENKNKVQLYRSVAHSMKCQLKNMHDNLDEHIKTK